MNNLSSGSGHGGSIQACQVSPKPFLANTLASSSLTSSRRTEISERKNKMDRQGCASCQKWRDHRSQDASRTRFIKFMARDFAQRLSIPQKFGNALTLNANATKRFSLKAPSGEPWIVGVTKHGDELCFTSGWGDFAVAHGLQENDLLVFTRSGTRSFDVMVFDASGCEKVSSFFMLGEGDPCRRKGFGGVKMGGQRAEHCGLSDSDDDAGTPLRLVESARKASALKKKSTAGRTNPGEESTESPDSSHEEEQSDDRRAGSNCCYYSRSASVLTEDEREEALSLVSIRPGNPAFVTVLQKSHMNRKNNRLIIQSEFASDHLEMRSHEVLLLRPGRKEQKWHVRYYHGSGTRGFGCRRWVKFVRDNRLRRDDVCVFELVKKGGARRTTMVVHVVRKRNGRLVLLG